MRIWIGILTIAVTLLGVGYFNLYCNQMTFDGNSAGIVISALGVLVTALVGWQVYNAIEMRSVIRECDNLKEQFEKSHNALMLQDEQNLALIEAFAKINDVSNNDYSFAHQYEMYLEALELFLKANVSLRYRHIIEINAILNTTLTSLKRGVESEKEQFIDREDRFNELYQNISNNLHKREEDVKQLSARLTSINNRRNEICKQIREEIKSSNAEHGSQVEILRQQADNTNQ